MSYQSEFEKDQFQTSTGNLAITFIGHGTLMMEFNQLVIHVDPFGRLADYGKLPGADLILITHEHQDHLDLAAINAIRTEHTELVMSASCSEKIKNGLLMSNWDQKKVKGIVIEAVPAYNLVHKRENGLPFHPMGIGNGYILNFGDLRVYIAGDTEKTPEMKGFKRIDIAFLPMNLPYTMTPEMVADAAAAFKPAILYPYHYGNTDTSQLLALLDQQTDTEIRIRQMS
jgi:L-ascorbate metabolism protein UlaG (beta-lactamase superfamily)